MAQKSVIKRIRVTRNGKIMRRAMALGHNRGNKSSVQKIRKERPRTLDIRKKILSKYL